MIANKIKKNIKPLHVNGMDGRILRMPAPKNSKKQILLLYGHHASLERLAGLAEAMNEYGAVTMPDLPGFGGMTSFYKIGQKPTLDNYADYLASLIKLYYKRRRFTIVAMSFSVPIAVRMMQKYPELAQKVDLTVSVAGFVRTDEFKFSKLQYWGLRSLVFIFEKRLPAFLLSKILLNKFVITTVYRLVAARRSKMKDASDQLERDRRIDFEAGLWKVNDVRTHVHSIKTALTLDLCNERIEHVPLTHVAASADRYFDTSIVEQHMSVIFDNVEVVPSDMLNHAPPHMSKIEEAKSFIPKRIQQVLSN